MDEIPRSTRVANTPATDCMPTVEIRMKQKLAGAGSAANTVDAVLIFAPSGP
jgi:hypothetical protein